MKIIDFDGIFDEKVAQFMKESKKKRSAKGWEDVIPKLYKQFGDTYIAKIKCTPKQYYENMSNEALVQTLSSHVEREISVPEFLIDELEKRDLTELLLPLLTAENAELVSYAVNLLGNDPRAFEGYFTLLHSEADEDVKAQVISLLVECADAVKEQALALYASDREEESALEIFSHVKERDERVYETLLAAFSESEEWQLALRAGYLATYGDERALPCLYRKIGDESIGFVEFQELKYAIEVLGGEYDEERDFSSDKDYLRVEAAKEKSHEEKDDKE